MEILRDENRNSEYKIWREQVFKRDNYTCQECGAKSQIGKRVYLHPHHLKSYTYYLKLRYEVSNGKTLCKKCHRELHFLKGGK